VRAAFGDHTVKFIQVRVKVVNVHSDPFHDIDILGEYDDGLKVALDEGSICKRTAEVEGFVPI